MSDHFFLPPKSFVPELEDHVARLRAANLQRGGRPYFTSILVSPEHHRALLMDERACRSDPRIVPNLEVCGIKVYVVPHLDPSPQFGYSR